MNWSGIPEKQFFGKVMRWPLKFIPAAAVLPVLQGPLRGRKWIVGSSTHGCWLGTYEYQKQRVFLTTVGSGSIVYDIGAHVGFYTLLASVIVGSEGKVFAFEPVPRNLHYLREHLRLNSCSNVTVIGALVSDSCGEIAFESGSGSSTGRIDARGRLGFESVALDPLVQRGEIPAPHYMKIDVEGAEMAVLTGARLLLSADHPTVFLATHGRGLHQECCDFLSSLGYRLSPIGGNSLGETDEPLACADGCPGRRS